MRITAQLLESGTAHHVWAERYDRDLQDIFAVQDEITRKIVAALDVQAAARRAGDASAVTCCSAPMRSTRTTRGSINLNRRDARSQR